MSSDNVQALTPGTRLGDYRLDAVIGHGGFGITYRAFDTQLAKFVAIKEYLPIEFAVRGGDGNVVPRGTRFADDFAWGRERFLDEARALARFRHPHIVPVLRYFEANGTAYTVMEFEDGKSVSELLRQPAGRLPPEDVRRLADGLVGGLQQPCMPKGFLHRDIKPSNIIIRRDGVPVLIDFGARAPGDGRALAHADRRADAAIRADRAVRLGQQAGPVDRHLLRRRRAPSRAASSASEPRRASAPLTSRPSPATLGVFLGAIDRALAFAPADRPQSVEHYARHVRTDDRPRRRCADAAPRTRSGRTASRWSKRGAAEQPSTSPARPGRRRMRVWVIILLIVLMGSALERRYRADLHTLLSGTPVEVAQPAPSPTPAPAPTPTPAPAPAATPQPRPPQATPTPPVVRPAPTPAPASDTSKQALIDQATRAAESAQAVLERADEAARAARAMGARSAHSRRCGAAVDLRNAERLTSERRELKSAR